jgi:predicted anti-sigma-YlaC factor YlaD
MSVYESERVYDSATDRLDLAPAGELCALVQDLLPLYLEGEVNAVSRDVIVSHLARCERCAGYLAGAQSVRVQLRREEQSQRMVRTATQPEQQTLQRWQRMLAGFTALFIAIVGGLASIALASGIYSGQATQAFLGLLIGSGALAALLVLARAVAPLAGSRLQQIGVGVLVGLVAPVVGQSHNVLFQMLAVFMALAALTLVSLAVAQGAQAQR